MMIGIPYRTQKDLYRYRFWYVWQTIRTFWCSKLLPKQEDRRMVALIFEILLAIVWAFLLVHSIGKAYFQQQINPLALAVMTAALVTWMYFALHPQL
jgi:hypothetical protein